MIVALITTIVEDGKVTSIQGEQQHATDADMWATDDEVDAYVRRVAEGVLVCRENGRHSFAPVRVTGMKFVRATVEGLLVRRVMCDSCGMVVRVELWDVRHKRGVVTRAELVSASLDYTDSSYLNPPGSGRMKPRQIRNAVASLDLAGQSFREVLRAANTAAGQARKRVIADD